MGRRSCCVLSRRQQGLNESISVLWSFLFLLAFLHVWLGAIGSRMQGNGRYCVFHCFNEDNFGALGLWGTQDPWGHFTGLE